MTMHYYRDPAVGRTDVLQTNDPLFVCSAGSNRLGSEAGDIHSDFTVLRPHGRLDYHLVQVKRGILYADYHGKTYLLYPGDLILYPPGTPQQYVVYQKDGSAYDWIHFKGSAVSSLLASLHLGGGVLRHGGGEDVSLSFSRLLREFRLRRPNFRAFCAAALSLLLCEIARTQERQTDAGTDRATRQAIYDIAAEMGENPGATRTLDDYARQLNLSRDRFVHLFRAVMGTPPHRYLTEARLSAARRLLRDSDLPIGEIALSLGYPDPLYFSRAFRREVGTSPREYRKR